MQFLDHQLSSVPESLSPGRLAVCSALSAWKRHTSLYFVGINSLFAKQCQAAAPDLLGF